jgi:hypothetical protein
VVVFFLAAAGARGESPLADEKPTGLGDPALGAALASIRREVFHADMAFLADDLLEGRGIGTRGHRLAALFVASQFKAVGLEPAGDAGTYFQSMPLVQARPREAACSVVVVADGKQRRLNYGSDFVMLIDPLGPDVVLQAPVVFVGHGVSAPEEHYDDYAGMDVTGRIVAYLPGAPSSFPDAPAALYGDLTRKRGAAADHGAVAVLSLSRPDERSSWAETTDWAKQGAMRLGETGATASPHRIPLLASLSPAGVEALFEGESNRLREAMEDLKAGRSHSFLLTSELSVTQRSERSALESANVIGTLRGSDPKLRGEYVVYTAHLDHLGIGEPVNGDAIYNGARDNASGVAGLLAVARAFALLPRSPRRSVTFVATTAEEPGLLGSQYFVDHPPVALQDIVAEINLDGLAIFWPLRDVAGWGSSHSSLRAAVEAAAARLGIEATIPEKDAAVMVGAGDQAPFAQNGVPAVWVVYGDKTRDAAVDAQALEEKWSRPHQPSDDMDKPFDFDSSVKLAQAAFLTGFIVTNEVSRPAWSRGDYFGGKFGARR